MRALVFFAAAAVALAAGCRNRDAPARPAAPTEALSAQAAAAPALCEHGVPADQCTKCNPDLVEAYKELGDWCDEHGLPESHCKECNPALTFTASADQDWCSEHAVPESMCTRCNPKLVAKFIADGDYCREHGFPQSVCPRCNPELAAKRGKKALEFPEPGTRVRLASAETAAEAGIRTERVTRRPFSGTVEALGQLGFDRNRLAQLTAREEAVVVEVQVDVGDDVKAGQPLVVLTAGAVGEDQGRYHAATARVNLARARVERERELADKGITPRVELEEVERELSQALAEQSAARASLSARGATTRGDAGRYVLRAPFAGTVVSRDAVPGRTAGREQVLIEVADLDLLWAELELPEAEASRVRKGHRVRLTLEGGGGERIEGKIARVAPAVDRHTRTVSARVELDNRDRRLKAGSFVRATIETSTPREAVVVPPSAVQRAEGVPLVFVAKAPGQYVPVPVKTGASGREGVEILEGLEVGAQVVTDGAFLLKTEILKDSIGAGCCEVEQPEKK